MHDILLAELLLEVVMKGMNFAGFLVVVVATFFVGHAVGRRSVQRQDQAAAVSAPPVVESASKDDTWQASGVVWYSQKNESWMFMPTGRPTGSSDILTKTEVLEHMLAPYIQQQSGSENRNAHPDCCCSFGVALTIRPLRDDKDPAPGDLQRCEVVTVHYVQVDRCYHCEHAIKAKRE